MNRLNAVLKEYADETNQYAARSLVTPLALPYKRYLNATSPISQLHRLIEFYEFGLRLSVIVGISEMNTPLEEKRDTPSWSSSLLQGPSMGRWNYIRCMIAKELSQESFFHQINSAFNNKEIDSIIKLRNDIAHGVEPSLHITRGHLNEWEPRTQRFVNELRHRLNWEIFLPLNLGFDGGEFQVSGNVASGDSITFPKLMIKTVEPMICNQLHLSFEMGEKYHWINLFPFILAEPSIEPNAWRILMFDKLTDQDTHIPIKEQSIMYIDIWSGRRNVVSDNEITGNALPVFLMTEPR